jgi:hypothetical protein
MGHFTRATNHYALQVASTFAFEDKFGIYGFGLANKGACPF